MKIFKKHFKSKNTYIIGKQIINGCVTCTIDEFDDVCEKHGVPDKMKQEVIKAYWENGEDENWEELVENSDWRVRRAVAMQGYRLDKLVNDEDEDVRAAVAKKGYGLDKLVNDRNAYVRIAVVKQGYGLDKLINDDCWQVRKAVALQGYRLDKLVNDEDEDVRAAVAKKGYGLDKLVNDRNVYVRTAAIKQLNKIKNIVGEFKSDYLLPKGCSICNAEIRNDVGDGLCAECWSRQRTGI